MNTIKDVMQVVHQTLVLMDVKDMAWTKLVFGTMAAETNFEELFDDEMDCYGYSMMSRDYIKDTIKSTINPSKDIRDKIHKATGIEIQKHTIPELLNIMRGHIGLQAALTYCGYKNAYLHDPNDVMEDLAGYYAYKWLQEADDAATVAKTRFKAAYKATLADK